MSGGRLVAFTSNMEDNSSEAGFQFTFFCDLCQEGYKTRFIESKTYKKGRLFRGLGRVAAVAGDLSGRGNRATPRRPALGLSGTASTA